MTKQWGNPTSGGAPAHLRRAALTRDNHTCQKCGSPAIEVDHIRPQAFGGTHDLDNLVSLCAPCHAPKSQREATMGKRRRAAAGQHPGDPHPGMM